MRLVDAQLFPHHDCLWISESDLSVFQAVDESSNIRNLDVDAALPFQDSMTATFMEPSRNERRSRS